MGRNESEGEVGRNEREGEVRRNKREEKWGEMRVTEK